MIASAPEKQSVFSHKAYGLDPFAVDLLLESLFYVLVELVSAEFMLGDSLRPASVMPDQLAHMNPEYIPAELIAFAPSNYFGLFVEHLQGFDEPVYGHAFLRHVSLLSHVASIQNSFSTFFGFSGIRQ
jgi:hypothetical protein